MIATQRVAGPVIIIPNPIAFLPTAHNVTCNGAANGSINFSTQNASAIQSFLWSGSGSGNNPRTNLAPGNYTITIQDSRGCTGTSSAITITQPQPLSIEAIAASPSDYHGYNVKCFGNSDGAISTVVSGGNPGASYYSWSTGSTGSSISNVGAGSYSVSFTDSRGCQAGDIVQVTAPPPMSVAIMENNGIDCPGSATGWLSSTVVQNAVGTVNYLWSSNETSSSINNKSAGNYSLTVTDGRGCTASNNHQLISPLPLTVSISPTSNYNGSRISCFGESDGSLQAVVQNPPGPVVPVSNYEWFRNNSPISGSSQASNLDAASYRVVVTYGEGCLAENTYLLQQPAPVSALISPISNYHGSPISCPGSSDGSLLATGAGGTSGNYTFEWEDGQTTSGINNIPAGTYLVYVTDINGCEGPASYDLSDPLPIVPSIAISSNYNGQALSCHGSSDAVLTANSLNGAAPIQFTWNTGFVGAIVNNLNAGFYTVTAVDANNCQVQSQQVEIPNPSPMQASISVLSDFNGQAIRCYNDANGIIRVSGAGGTGVYSFLWSISATTPEINNLAHGNYSVVVSDQNNCQDSDQINLQNPAEVLVGIKSYSNFNGYEVQCHGSANGFIEVEASGGTGTYSFLWPSLSETTPLVEDLSTGIYGVVVSDLNGCQSELSYQITEPDPLTIVALSTSNITCFGGSDGLLVGSAGGGAGTFKYSLNEIEWQDSPQFSALIANEPYQLTVRDGNRCTSSIVKSLAQPEEIVIEFSVTPSLCAEPVGEASALVTGGSGQLTFEWIDSENEFVGNSSTLTNLPAGIYTLRMMDEHQCKVENSIGIPSLDGPILEVSQRQPASCFNSANGSATIEVVQGNGPFLISWEDGQHAWFRSDLMLGTHYASVVDINKCVTVVPVLTNGPDELSLELVEKIDPSCFEFCDGKIRIGVEGGNGEYQFEWNSLSGTDSASDLCAGTYQINVMDKLGCSHAMNVTLSNPEQLSLKVESRKLPDCSDGCDGAMNVKASGGNGPYTYLWNTGSTSSNQENICPGSHQVIVKDSHACEVVDTFSLGNVTKVEADLIQLKTPVCYRDCNGVLEVAAHGGAGNYRYVWEDGTKESSNSSLCAGLHQIVISDENDCQIRQTYKIPEVPELKIDLGSGVVLCEGQQYELKAGSSWKNVEWRKDEKVLSMDEAIIITEPGEYLLEVKDANNCKASDTFTMETSNDLLEASFILAGEAAVGDTVVIIDISWPMPDNISWTFPDKMKKLRDLQDVVYGAFEDGGEYAIILSAALGECRDDITKTITILDKRNPTTGGRLGGEEFVKLLTLHPNPNTGSFEVEVEFADVSPVAMFVWNIVNSKLVAEVRDDGASVYKKSFNLAPISSGMYMLKIEFNGGARVLRFLVH